MEKTLTISIAAYNVEAFIRQTLDSLLDESILDELEILVIDDGGTDRTLEIAREYAARYPQSVFPIHKENGGYGSTINTGIERATGKYFKQLDGDDWYSTENLVKFVNILKNTSADCVLTYYYVYQEQTQKYSCKKGFEYLKEGEYEIESINLKERFSIKNVAYKTEILKKMPERLTEHCFYTDAEFAVYPVLYVNTICICHLPVYVYRIGRGEQSVSIEGIQKHYPEQETVFWNVANFYVEKINSTESIKQKVILYTLEMLYRDWYKFRCVLPLSRERYKEMRRFGKEVNAMCPVVIEEGKKVGRVFKCLINSNCLIYPLAHIYYRRRWLAE